MRIVPGQENHDVSLTKLNTWHIGGPARTLYLPLSVEDLQRYLMAMKPSHLFWLGLGSNVLIRDGGIEETVLLTKGLNRIERLADGRVYAEAGVPCAKLAKFCSKQGLKGAEFFAGIPGTVGGALMMNAGAFGGQTWENVHSVDTISLQGQRHHCCPSEFEVGYRSVQSPHLQQRGFVAGYFTFESGGSEALLENIRQLLQKRNATQPIGTFNCGSVFKNPPDDHAARLIEAAGLKGYSIGEAQVSPKHANFIINHGQATAFETEQIIRDIQEAVQTKFGVHLNTEVKIIGKQGVFAHEN